MFRYFSYSILLFSSSPLFTVLIIRLFLILVMINNMKFWVGPDRTDEVDDEVGNRHACGTRRGGRNRYMSYNILFSTLLLSSSRFSPFPIVIVYLQYDNRRGGAGRNGTSTGGAAAWAGTGGQAGGKGR